MFKKLGYAFCESIFDRKEIISLKQEMENIFREYSKNQDDQIDDVVKQLYREDLKGFLGCANASQSLLSLHRISCKSEMTDALKKIGLEIPCVNTRPLVSFSSRDTASHDIYWKVPAHQDWPSVQGSLNGVTCWVPLCDVNEKIGCLEIVPGSHMLGALPYKSSREPFLLDQNQNHEFLSMPMKVGDALFFSSFLIHRSGNNTSNRIRWSSHFRYDDCMEETFIERQFPRAKIDKRCDDLLFPDFPSQEQVWKTFS
jgi:ectoine hydroxylase-related dioxygenase (phytanoyl-CoA dioxygenase family)